MIERIKKYEILRSLMTREVEELDLRGEDRTCPLCGGPAENVGINNETGKYVYIHRSCLSSQSEFADVPYPVKMVTSKNIRNHTGMGNQWVSRSPSQKFFDGLSGNPRQRERIDFNGHVVYMTIERAKRDGLMK